MSTFSREKYFEKHYPLIFQRGLIGSISNFMHRSMEIGMSGQGHEKILEIAAGHSNHQRFIKQGYQEYHETDIYIESLPKRSDSIKLKQFELNANETSKLPSNYYDRIIVSCLLIHLNNPKEILNSWLHLLKPGGSLTILVPCEPGALLRFARRISTVKKSQKLGIDYYSIHFSEHVTYFLRAKYYIDNLDGVKRVKWKYFPFGIPFWNINLWTVAQIDKK